MAEPYCLAMVLCDHVHRDRATGKCSILGTFSVINATEFPTTVRFFVYTEITDGYGKIDLALRLTESSALLNGGDGFVWQPDCLAVEIPDPLAVMQVVFVVSAELPKAGAYHCDLLANGQEIMARRLIVIDKTKPSGGES